MEKYVEFKINPRNWSEFVKPRPNLKVAADGQEGVVSHLIR